MKCIVFAVKSFVQAVVQMDFQFPTLTERSNPIWVHFPKYWDCLVGCLSVPVIVQQKNLSQSLGIMVL